MASRKEQQADLLIKFGELIAPLDQLAKYPEEQTAQTRAKATAKFKNDVSSFMNSVLELTRGEPGHFYHVEHEKICGAINFLESGIGGFRDDPEKLREYLTKAKREVRDGLNAIPCELDSEVLVAGSPFTAYLKLRSICETASRLLVFVDPFLGQGAVRRYFHGIPDSVCVTVITEKRSGEAFRDFVDVSKLYADERGQDKYRLLFHPGLRDKHLSRDIHDRYLKCDDEVYHLGGSLKDAGRNSDYTITKIRKAADGHAAIEKLISESTEQFGPSQATHPTP